jgi:hypothetical protein
MPAGVKIEHWRSSTTALRFIRVEEALVDLRDNYDAQFQLQRPIPENYPCLAMQDVFDLSLTWDDLKFLGAVRIQPLGVCRG